MIWNMLATLQLSGWKQTSNGKHQMLGQDFWFVCSIWTGPDKRNEFRLGMDSVP
jgi:hypothetical protein